MLRKLGLAEYEMPQREQYVIDGWTKSLSDYQADVIFLGDSITWGGDWNSYFEDVNLCCLAIPGDEIEQVLYRTDMVVDLEPKKIFIMMGVNGSRNVNYEEILKEKYSELIVRLVETGAEIYIQSILPVCEPSKVSNDRIDGANQILKELADQYGCTYINLHDAFSDEEEKLSLYYSKDGVHINESGYDLWVSLIEGYIYE